MGTACGRGVDRGVVCRDPWRNSSELQRVWCMDVQILQGCRHSADTGQECCRRGARLRCLSPLLLVPCQVAALVQLEFHLDFVACTACHACYLRARTDGLSL